MTVGAYFAWEHGLPCKNPNCKSYGKPHPNCMCYGERYAEGGDVEPFCSKAQMHKEGCEYFQGGGQAGDNFFESDAQPIDAPASAPEAMPANDDFFGPEAKPVAGNDFFESDAQPIDEDKYNSTGQRIANVAEGVGQGFLGPIPTAIETGISKLAPDIEQAGFPNVADVARNMAPEEIASRQAANPIDHTIAEMVGFGGGALTGYSEAALLSRAGALAKGSAALKGAIQFAGMQASDEMTKAILGQGDPEHPVAAALVNTGVAGLIGAPLGKLGNMASNLKIGTKIDNFLLGVGVEASKETWGENKFIPEIADDEKAFKGGQKFYSNMMEGLGKHPVLAAGTGAYTGYRDGGLEGAMKGAGIGLGLSMTSKYASPIIARTIASQINKEFWQDIIVDVLNHAKDISGGEKMINRGIDSIFMSAPQQAANAVDMAKDRDKLDEYIKNGGILQNIKEQTYQQMQQQRPQGFAEGGDVMGMENEPGPVAPIMPDNDGVATVFPEQKMLMTAARNRVSNYLSALRPQEIQPKLPYDDEPDMTQQRRAYDKALDVAVHPLGVLDGVKKGTIEASDVKHLSSMYPEITNHLQKMLTKRMAEGQLKGESKPSYIVRQGLSMLLGAALSAEYTPSNIRAAQATFQPSQPSQPPPQGKAKSSKASLSKSEQAYLTDDQAREKRQQREK